MKILSKSIDYKIKTVNILCSFSFLEYVDLSKKIIYNNEFQRRRVKSSNTIYSLLKKDIESGCIIPPIILAHRSELSKDLDYLIDIIDIDFITNIIDNNSSELIILDGLQRSLIMLDLSESYKDIDYRSEIRIEILFNITTTGIIYRMLTFNTGQTQMSLRHQIEILFSSLKFNDEEIELISEKDNALAKEINQFKFIDIIEAFNAYLERSEMPINRVDILDYIDKINIFTKYDFSRDILYDFTNTYYIFLTKVINFMNYEKYSKNYIDLFLNFFKRPQAISGFGASIGNLIDNNVFSNFSEVQMLLESKKMVFDDNTFNNLVIIDIDIKENAKKIGNEQRKFFLLFFNNFLYKENSFDCFLNFDNSFLRARKDLLINRH